MDYEDSDFIKEAQRSATLWARTMLDRSDWVILDTETTGLGGTDEVVQVSIMGKDGAELFNSLVKPTCEIDPRAEAVHGISKELLQNAPCFAEVWPKIIEAIGENGVVIYNADFDVRMLRQSAWAARISPDTVSFLCYDAMEQYAKWYGEWNEYRGSFRWQKLPGGDHSAMGDCRATLALIQRMAQEG